jgi:hypothetical protein
LLFRKVAICWPVASFTIFARVRFRKARFARGSLNVTVGLPKVPRGRFFRVVTSVVSMRMARLNLFAGTVRLGRLASPKS